MKVLVTGHKGFVGNKLYKKLKENNYGVIGYDRGSSLSAYHCDLVFHLAANPKALESINSPCKALENIKTTFNVLEYMRRVHCRKIIFASSTEISGLKTPYSASKLASENLIEAYCNSYGMGAISLRFSNIYGPGDRKDRFIPTAIKKAKEDKPIKIYGKSGNFVFIDDCINIYMDSMKLIELGKHKTYEVINNKSSLVSVAKKIIKMTGSKSKIELVEGLRETI